LAVDDTVLYGRVLVTQWRNRVQVMEGDSRVNAPSGSNGKA
jgi:hypothetical protein